MTRSLILNIPHSSTLIPKEYLQLFTTSSDQVNEELRCMTDWYVDDLFKSYLGETVKARVSRLVCDMERFEDDKMEPMSKKGMGVCYTKDHCGNEFKVVSTDHKEEILSKYYKPYHKKLTRFTSSSLRDRGSALILDCHSFSSIPFSCDSDQYPDRPDFCIGVDPYHTPMDLVEFACRHFASNGRFTVEVNSPFSGSLVPIKYYGKDKRVSSIMIEVNRSLYMDEKTLVKKAAYGEIKDLIQSFIDSLYFSGSSEFEKLNLDSHAKKLIQKVRENNGVITRFESVQFVRNEGFLKRYRCSYRLGRDSMMFFQCDYMIGYDFIEFNGYNLKISNRAARQLREAWQTISSLAKRSPWGGSPLPTSANQEYRILKCDGNRYSLVEMSKNRNNWSCSNIPVANGNWYELASSIGGKDHSPISFVTAKKLLSKRPDLSENELCRFTELEARCFFNALETGDSLLSAGIMHLHRNETPQENEVLSRLDDGRIYFHSQVDTYDLSDITFSTMKHVITGYLRRYDYYEVGVIIGNQSFNAKWSNSSLSFTAGHREETILLSDECLVYLNSLKTKIAESNKSFNIKELTKET